jgi:hypothetical protein
MAKEQKAKALADFQFVKGKGIHPFYLNMTIDQVLDAAIGWKIVSTERDDGIFTQAIYLEKDGKRVEVGVIDVRASIPNARSHYQTYWVSTHDGIMSDGQKISLMKREEALKIVLVDFEISSEYVDYEEDVDCSVASYFTPDCVNGLLFAHSDKHLLRVSHVPLLGDD